jgi:hypothetical protein
MTSSLGPKRKGNGGAKQKLAKNVKRESKRTRPDGDRSTHDRQRLIEFDSLKSKDRNTGMRFLPGAAGSVRIKSLLGRQACLPSFL